MKKIRFNDGVFNRIIGSDREFSAYDRFINTQKGIRSNSKTEKLVDFYKRMVYSKVDFLEQTSHLEDLIILLRIRENMNVELYVQSHKGREYIYARQACPRDTKNKDIRICVGRTDVYPPDIDPLDNAEVLQRAEDIIAEYLDQLIREKEFIVNTLIKEYAEEAV